MTRPRSPPAERVATPIFKDTGDGKISAGEGLERIRTEADRLLTT
jgi:hypothetical protein